MVEPGRKPSSNHLDPDARHSLEIRIECKFSMPKSHRALMKLGGEFLYLF